jgi:hypothetical protein
MTDLFTTDDVQHADVDAALILVEALDLRPLPDDERPAWDVADDGYDYADGAL